MPKFAPYPLIVSQVSVVGIGNVSVVADVDSDEVTVVLLIEVVPL
jgi:hypothetical protein